MASAAGSLYRLSKLAAPLVLPAVAYGAYKGNVAAAIEAFFTGPGRTSRIVALVVVLVNWKSLPLAWTFRIFNAMISHFLVRPFHDYTPDQLFQPVVTESHVTLLEVDYNIHKSNSTYFADLDVSRSHLVAHLLARGCHALSRNAVTKLVLEPPRSREKQEEKEEKREGEERRPAKGKFNIMLGGVQCSFKKEIKPYGRYEIWSRILSWDRKWMYIVTHFVEKGAAVANKSGSDKNNNNWEKRIHASAVSKYVFKMGRLTVHPAIVIEASGLLPERPGGWVRADDDEDDSASSFAQPLDDDGGAPQADNAESAAAEWDWKRTEEERRKGLEYAQHFASLDELLTQFEPGGKGILGKFGPG
ncbi:capsule polysaccharide biosynthesis protein [Xylariaceae sp. FL0594]|nr:capsule polysaccharide biosynthesis protein [Xylariaceae sp. FL0594]